MYMLLFLHHIVRFLLRATPTKEHATTLPGSYWCLTTVAMIAMSYLEVQDT